MGWMSNTPKWAQNPIGFFVYLAVSTIVAVACIPMIIVYRILSDLLFFLRKFRNNKANNANFDDKS